MTHEEFPDTMPVDAPDPPEVPLRRPRWLGERPGSAPVWFALLWVALTVVMLFFGGCGERTKPPSPPREGYTHTAITTVHVTSYGPNLIETTLPDGTRCIYAWSGGVAPVCRWPGER